MGGVADAIGSAVGGIGDLIGQGTEWVGERTGLGFLNNAGEYIANDENAWIQQLLGTATLGGLGYGAFNYFMPTDGMFFGGAEGLYNPVAGYEMLDPSMNDIFTWEGGLTGANGFDATSAPWYSGLGEYMPSLGSSGNLGLAALMGTNLLGQYAAARSQQNMANDSFSKQLAAQQAYQAAQRQDIANAQNTALANWQQYGFPNQGAVQAGINQGKNTIKQNTKAAGQQLDEALAARNVGGGVVGSEWGKLLQNQQNNIGSLTNQMTQFGLTPYSAPPITMAYPGMPGVPQYAQPTSFGERAASMIGGVTGSYAGEAAKAAYAQPNYMNEYFKMMMGLG